MTIEPVTFAEDGADAPAAAPVRRPRGWRRLAVGVAVAATLGVAALWFGRIPVADHFIASQLAARGVPARYTLNRIGPRTQRLENVVLGDPASPDLSARWVEVDIGYAGFSPAVTAVRVSGLRLRGAWRGGRLTLGVLDRLLGEGTGKAELPDIDLTIIDGRTSISTDFGQAGLAISGTGRLYGGFSGAAAIAAPRLAASGCILEDMRGHVAVSTASGRLSVKGPLQARQLGCAGADAMLLAPDLGLDVRLAKAFDGASGALTLAAPALKMGGGVFARPAGLLTFDGPFAEMTGSHSFSVESAKTAQLRSGPVKLGGRFALRGDPQNSALTSSLMLAAADLAMADERTLPAMAGKLVDTPLAPFARRFGDAVRRAGLGNSLTLRGRLRWTGLGGDAVMERGRLVAESGARIELAAPARLVIDQARSLWEVKGGFRAGGGGLPDIAFDAGRARDGRVSGRLEMEPYAAEGARLALAPMPFTLMPGSGEGALRTILTLDGPLPGGRVKGLTIPLDLRLREDGGFALAGSCTPVRWTSLTLSSAQFDRADLRLCAEQGQPLLAREGAGLRGGVVLGQVLLKGRIGAAPLSVKTSSARLGLAGLRFALNDIAVRLGDSSAPTLFDAARIDGGAKGRGFQGRLGGAHARIGAVPLDLGQIEGGWTFVDGRLALSGALVVSDTAPEPRFFPLLVPDARLALIDGKTGAQGTLRHAGRNRAVATVRIAHDLGAGAGSATFDLGDLAFSSGLQPDDLTPMARGVVADVQARVTGKGRIDWSAAGVTSNGIFSTENARFAAAFGPVEGFSTTLRFEDLLGLRSAPGQTIRVAGINPGIEVRDGVIRYALLSSELARIEGGRWPFAGGELDLLPATLDLDSRKARHLAFRVMGLDAGAFINTLDLKDISATGTFDGLLPMIFDQHGGRIEGGILVARQPGLPPLLVENASTLTVPCDPSKTSGTLSYVGQISNEQLGAMGTLAFEALKNLRYRCLTVLLDGALDGEFVTRIAINGINQGTPAAASSFLTRPFLGLPFLFNVRIEAPFRGLLNTAQSFIDPSNLVRESLGPQYQTVLDAGAGAEPGGEGKPPLAVQPPESDKGVMKERK